MWWLSRNWTIWKAGTNISEAVQSSYREDGFHEGVLLWQQSKLSLNHLNAYPAYIYILNTNNPHKCTYNFYDLNSQYYKNRFFEFLKAFSPWSLFGPPTIFYPCVFPNNLKWLMLKINLSDNLCYISALQNKPKSIAINLEYSMPSMLQKTHQKTIGSGTEQNSQR